MWFLCNNLLLLDLWSSHLFRYPGKFCWQFMVRNLSKTSQKVSRKSARLPFNQHWNQEERQCLYFRTWRTSLQLILMMQELLSTLSRCNGTAPDCDEIPWLNIHLISIKVFLPSIMIIVWKRSNFIQYGILEFGYYFSKICWYHTIVTNYSNILCM